MACGAAFGADGRGPQNRDAKPILSHSNNLCRVGTTGCGLKPLNACCLEKATTTFKGGQLYLKDVFQPQSLKAWDGQK